MKDLITKSKKGLTSDGREIMSAVLLHIFMAVMGFIASRGVVFETLMPSGLIMVGGATTVFLPSVAVGAFVGYFIPAVSGFGFKYIASVFAVIAIRLMLSSYKKISENPLFLSVITALTNIFTGAVTYSGIPVDILKIATEAIIIFGAVFAVNRTFLTFSDGRTVFSYDESGCLLVTVSVILIGLDEFTVFDVSVGRILGTFLILAASKYGGASIGAFCGIAVSFCSALTGSFESGAGIYAISGLAGGIFSSLGKYVQCVAVIATAVIGLSFVDFDFGAGVFIAEIIAGCLIFIFTSRSAGIFLSKFFHVKTNLTTENGFNKAISLRLNLASDALLDVSDTVNQVSKELAKINAPDFKSVLSLIEQDACVGCKLRMHCWENKSDATIEAVMQMINRVKDGELPQNEPKTDEFFGRCLRIKRMEDAVQKRYTQYASGISAENRIEEVRQVVSEQFEGISDMLKELSCDFLADEQFDVALAENAVAALHNLGINTSDCTAKIDKYGRTSLEMQLELDEGTVLNRLQIMKMLSISCERDFDIPNITKIKGGALLTVNEHPVYRVDIGAEQISATAGAVCGDAYKYFNDGKGHFLIVLSDGMGTGGRAAVDGAMASGLMTRLIKAGFGFDCSLKILNSTMLFKSSDESLATVDIASIDLFTGNTQLYKAGAAPTLVRRGGRTGRAESKSLPVGILKEVSFDRAAIKLKVNDILMLVSDGVTFDGTEWIRDELENWQNGTAQDLAEHICTLARRRHTDTRADDITVITAIIEKTV